MCKEKCREEKILFRDLTDKEKMVIMKAWENVSIKGLTSHSREKMALLNITGKDIERTLKNNDIIEYKVVNGNLFDDVRILIKGRDVVRKKYEWTQGGQRQLRGVHECNVCLVISLKHHRIVTTYTSESNNDSYRNSKMRHDKAYRLFMTRKLENGLKLLA